MYGEVYGCAFLRERIVYFLLNMKGNPQSTIPRLFLAFLRLGLTAFGGPAMVIYIRRLAVEKEGWLEGRQFDDGVALCQTIPGATAMQTAAYVGLSARGVAGAAASFIGFGLPAFALMLTMTLLYTQVHELPMIVAAFKGLGAIIVAIVANAAVSFGRRSLKGWRQIVVAAVAALSFRWGGHPFLVIALCGLLGLLLLKPEQYPSSMQAENRHFGRSALLILAVSAVIWMALFPVDRQLFDLAAVMSRIDLFAFGGGYASVPLMLHEVVNLRHWLDDTTFMHGIVLGQVTPGPIVITATFVGVLLRGLLGGVVATLSVFLPSFVLVVALAPRFDRLRSSATFNKIIGGVLCSFVGLLLSVTLHFSAQIPWDFSRVLLAGAALIALQGKVDILWVVLIGTAASIVLCR
jgi:chromate transporter